MAGKWSTIVYEREWDRGIRLLKIDDKEEKYIWRRYMVKKQIIRLYKIDAKNQIKLWKIIRKRNDCVREMIK